MKKISELIVKYRNFIMLLFLGFLIFSGFCIPKVQIEYDISSYLPSSTDTAQAIEIMDKEFVTYGTTTVVINNISYEEADDLHEQIVEIKGVKDLPFENNEKYFNNSKALFKITFNGDANDKVCVEAYNEIKNLLKPYESFESVSLVDNYADTLANEMKLIVLLAAIVIIVILLFTSRSYAEVGVLLIVFVVAAIFNMGTNYRFGKISFVSNSVCIILQLALAIDYSIILLHRFIEECEAHPRDDTKSSMVTALSKSIPEIFGSSLTTISGLLALVCMTFKLGQDLGLVLSKSIIFSILTVVLLMPGLLLKFSKLIKKTRHKNFVPKINWFGKGILKIRYVLITIFLVCVTAGGYLSSRIDYCYTNNGIQSNNPTEVQKANAIISENFGYQNQFVIVVPNGNYQKQKELLEFMESKEYIDEALGLANIEVKDGYYLCDSINYYELTNIIDLDINLSKMLFYYYALSNEDFSIIVNNNLDNYKVTIIDLLDTVFQLQDDKYITFAPEEEKVINELRAQLEDGKKQLLGENYSRLVFNLNLPEEGKDTFKIIQELREEIRELYPEAICGGNTMVAYDLNSSFLGDNILISILTIVFVFIVLIFTCKSWGMPILLVGVIQGAIFINFAIPVLLGQNVFFFVYLIASAIQMGATIDYAIVISGRYTALRKTHDKKESVINALNESFPTIISSGAILSIAALLIGAMSSDLLISSIGYTISRGTIVSILCVMIALPLLLYLLDKPLQFTYFKPKEPKETKITKKQKNLLNYLTNNIYDEFKRIEASKKKEELENKSSENNVIEIETDTENEVEVSCEVDEKEVNKDENSK